MDLLGIAERGVSSAVDQFQFAAASNVPKSFSLPSGLCDSPTNTDPQTEKQDSISTITFPLVCLDTFMRQSKTLCVGVVN